MSRATQGVTLINLGPDEKLAGLQKIVDSDDAEGDLDANSSTPGDYAGDDGTPAPPETDGPEEQN